MRHLRLLAKHWGLTIQVLKGCRDRTRWKEEQAYLLREISFWIHRHQQCAAKFEYIKDCFLFIDLKSWFMLYWILDCLDYLKLDNHAWVHRRLMFGVFSRSKCFAEWFKHNSIRSLDWKTWTKKYPHCRVFSSQFLTVFVIFSKTI